MIGRMENDMTMVLRIFDTLTDAQRAVSDLVGSGYARKAISVLVRDALAHTMPRSDDAGDGPLTPPTSIIAGGPLGDVLHRGTDMVSPHAVTRCLKLEGLQPSAAQFFADAICDGGILVAVHCDDGDVRYAREILDINGPVGQVTAPPRHAH
jgi:hypothetical protein